MKHESDPVLIRERAKVRMISGIAGEVLNEPSGFYNCCGGFRYVGKNDPPFEITCPECGELVSNYSILHRASIEASCRSNPEYLRIVFDKTLHYHPILCDLIKSTIKSKKYPQAVELGWSVHARAEADKFKGTSPLDLICLAILEWESEENRRGNSDKAKSLRSEYCRIQKEYFGKVFD